ncbi:3,4-dihydroxy-2-butanone-4-phosphate synthase [Rhodococcus sp. 5G237]
MTLTSSQRDTDVPQLVTRHSVRTPGQPRHSSNSAIEHLAGGGLVIVSGLRGHGFLVVAAHAASTAAVAFMVRYSSGFVQIALPRGRCEELMLPPMNPFDTGEIRMCVGVDAVQGTSTGISAADRATTARVLVDPGAGPRALTRPGHLVPIAIDPCASDMQDSAAAIALSLTAGTELRPGALFAELVGINDPTQLMSHAECVEFSETHHLPLITVR